MSERTEGRQNVLVHEGVESDPGYDSNERADDTVEVQQPDGTPVPRPKDDS